MRALPFALTLFATPIWAEIPQVVTDIAPVHSLVAQVMQGVGTPTLLVDQASSPHHMQLRPSQVHTLDDADLIVWVGAALTPWLDRVLHGVQPGASLELLRSEATLQHAVEEDHDGHDGHDHGDEAMDPHAWLDPENARIWVALIAAELTRLDPENGPTYAANAAQADAALIDLIAEVASTLTTLQPVVTAHQAYGHFAARFAVPIAGHIALGDGAAPSAAHLADLRAALLQAGVTCVFTEPQLDPGLAFTVTEGSSVVVSQLDPLGATLDSGPDLYGNLIRSLGRGFSNCPPLDR